MTTFTVTIKSVPGYQHILDKYGRQLSNLIPLWNLYEKYLAPVNAMRVFVQGQSTWTSLNEVYLKRKIKKGYMSQTLTRKGRMFLAFRRPNSKGNVSIKKAQYWIYGVNSSLKMFRTKSGKSYPIIHQEGSGRVPARPFIVITPWMQQYAMRIFYKYISSIMKEDKLPT